MPIQSLEDLENLVSGAFSQSVAIDTMNQAAYDVRYQNPNLMLQAGALALQRASGFNYLRGMADAQRNIGVAYALLTEPHSAKLSLELALELYQELQDDAGETQALASLAGVHQLMGEFEDALEVHGKVLRAAERRGNAELRGNSLYNMGLVYMQTGQYAQSLKAHQASLAIRQVLVDDAGTTLSMCGVGEALRALERLDDSEKILKHALDRARRLGQDFLIGQPLLFLSDLFIDREEYDMAAQMLDQAVEHHRTHDDLAHLADTYLMQAKLAIRTNDPVAAKLKIEACLQLADNLELEILRRNAEDLLAQILDTDSPQLETEPEKIGNLSFPVFGSEEQAKEPLADLPKPETATRSAHNTTPEASAVGMPEPTASATVGQPPEIELTAKAIAGDKLANFLAFYLMDPKLSVDLLNATWRLRLPTVEQLRRRLPESFVFHLPLPGPCTDFYIQAERDDALYLGIANAPGEGIEISLFTQLAYEYLATLMYHPNYVQPSEILNAFQEYIRPALNHSNWTNKPEIRLAVVRVDQSQGTITFSGAGLSIYWRGTAGWEELSIGHSPLRGREPLLEFADMELNGNKGNQLYLSTDGYSQLAAVAGLPPLIEQLKEMQGYDFSLKAPVLKSIIDKVLKSHDAPDDILILGAGL